MQHICPYMQHIYNEYSHFWKKNALYHHRRLISTHCLHFQVHFKPVRTSKTIHGEDLIMYAVWSEHVQFIYLDNRVRHLIRVSFNSRAIKNNSQPFQLCHHNCLSLSRKFFITFYSHLPISQGVLHCPASGPLLCAFTWVKVEIP